MSVSGIINANDNKINLKYLPNPYPFPAQPNGLGAVLTVSNEAGDNDIVGLNQLEVRKVVQQQGLLGEFLQIGDASGGDLRIQGATTKGSILAGNGTSTIGLPVGATGYVLKSNPATVSGLEWAIDISGVTGVVGVNAGTNIDISGTVSQPIVSLQSPLTSTLNMGSVALQDISGATGTAGQFLSAGAGGQAKWATPPDTLPTITAGNNIDISGTQANPIVSLDNPLTAQLNMGTQSIFYGASTAVRNATSTATETIYQEGGAGGGSITASYGFSAMQITNIPKVINMDGNGIVNVDQSVGTQTVDNRTTPTSVIINSQDNIGGGFNRSTLENQTLTMASQDAGTPTLTTTAIYGNCSTSEVIIDTTTPATSQHTTTNTSTSIDENFNIAGGAGESLALFNLKSAGSGSDYQTLYTASTGDSIQQRQIVSGGGSVFFQQFNEAGGTVSTTNNLQTNVTQTVASMSYGSSAGNVSTIGIEGDATRVRVRNLYQTPSLTVGNINTGTTTITDSTGCSLTQTFTEGAISRTTALSTTSSLASLSTDAPLTISAGGNLNVSSSATVGVAGTFLTLTSSGAGGVQLNAPAGNIQYSSSTGQQVLVSSANSVSVPTYTITNTNASTASYPAIKMDRPTPVSVAGDVIGAISTWADDGAGNSREWSRIQTKTENVSGGNQDGTLSIFNSVNGTVSETFNFNGGQNENNSFRPLDLNGNALRTTSGSMTIDTSPSSTAGAVLTLATKDNVAGSGAGLALTGNTLLSPTSGGSAGQHLCLTIGGTVYKIQLLNP